jgi:hypothetical protein
VNGGHETLLNAPVVVDDLSHWSKAVSGARSVGDDALVTLVLLVVNTVHIYGGVVLGRCGHDDLLGTIVKMKLSLLLSKVSTSAVSNVLTACVTPLKLRSILLLEDSDLLPVDFDTTLNLVNSALEATYKYD